MLSLSLVLGLAEAHGGPGSGLYIENQRAGPYLITVRVDTPTAEHGREPVEVSVRVEDAQMGNLVTSASVVAVAALRDKNTGELIMVRPYQVIESLSEIGLYQVILPLHPLGPWEILVSVWQDSNFEERGEVYFKLHAGTESFPWFPVALGAIALAVGSALLFLCSPDLRLRFTGSLKSIRVAAKKPGG